MCSFNGIQLPPSQLNVIFVTVSRVYWKALNSLNQLNSWGRATRAPVFPCKWLLTSKIWLCGTGIKETVFPSNTKRYTDFAVVLHVRAESRWCNRDAVGICLSMMLIGPFHYQQWHFVQFNSSITTQTVQKAHISSVTVDLNIRRENNGLRYFQKWRRYWSWFLKLNEHQVSNWICWGETDEFILVQISAITRFRRKKT